MVTCNDGSPGDGAHPEDSGVFSMSLIGPAFPVPRAEPVWPSPTCLTDFAKLVRGLVRACHRGGLVRVGADQVLPPGSVRPSDVLGLFFDLNRALLWYQGRALSGWDPTSATEINYTLAAIRSARRSIVDAWRLGDLFQATADVVVVNDLTGQDTRVAVKRFDTVRTSEVQAVVSIPAPLPALDEKCVQSLLVCAIEFERIATEGATLWRVLPPIETAQEPLVRDRADARRIEKTPGPPTAPREADGSTVPVPKDASGTAQQARGRKPSDRRAKEIVAVIRRAGKPLTYKDISKKIPSGKSSLRANLSWMVYVSRILVKIDQGYWLADEPIPQENPA